MSNVSVALAESVAVSSATQPLIHSLRYSIDFLEEQVGDVDQVEMVQQPAGVSNHPAWTIGHLAHVLQLIGTVVGLDEALPESWIRRYGPGSKPVSDSNVYESKQEALSVLRDIRDRLIATVEELNDDELDQPFPDPAYRDVFPSIRHALTQVLVGHTAFHVGQISVWRRAMGLPGLTRSYE